MHATITGIVYTVAIGFAVALGFLFPVIPPDICVGVGLAAAAITTAEYQAVMKSAKLRGFRRA